MVVVLLRIQSGRDQGWSETPCFDLLYKRDASLKSRKSILSVGMHAAIIVTFDSAMSHINSALSLSIYEGC